MSILESGPIFIPAIELFVCAVAAAMPPLAIPIAITARSTGPAHFNFVIFISYTVVVVADYDNRGTPQNAKRAFHSIDASLSIRATEVYPSHSTFSVIKPRVANDYGTLM